MLSQSKANNENPYKFIFLIKKRKMVNVNEQVVRTIRMEQRVAGSLNKNIKYNEAKAYRNLNKKQRQEFEDYMDKEGRTKHTLLILAVLFYVTFGIFYFRATGNVVKSIIGIDTFSALGNIFNLLFVLVTSIIIIMFLVNFFKELRFRKNFNIKKYL